MKKIFLVLIAVVNLVSASEFKKPKPLKRLNTTSKENLLNRLTSLAGQKLRQERESDRILSLLNKHDKHYTCFLCPFSYTVLDADRWDSSLERVFKEHHKKEHNYSFSEQFSESKTFICTNEACGNATYTTKDALEKHSQKEHLTLLNG